jgi:DNA-binding transcriptional ArsR family regulator
MCYGPVVPIAEPELLDQSFHALADGNRRAILARLTLGAASVSELAAPLGVSLPTVLQHLDVLQRSGLVHSEKVGRVRTCRLEPGPMRAVEHWIAEHRATWERRLDLMGDVLDDVFPTTKGHRST